MEDLLYFITLKLRSSGAKVPLIQASRLAFREFDGFYVRMCQGIVRARFKPNPKHHPKGLAFLDFAGTRFPGRPPGHYLTDPHIHAVLLIHPATEDRFQRFRARIDQLVLKWPGIHSIRMDRFDPAKCTLSKLITYCGKLEPRTGFGEWRLYPAESPAGRLTMSSQLPDG